MFLNQSKRSLSAKDFEYSGIDLRYWDVQLEKIKDSCSHRNQLMKYSDNICSFLKEGTGLFLFGPYRTGKTASGIIILKEAMSWGRSCHFVTAQELRNDLAFQRREYDDGENSYPIKNRYQKVDLLMIDDIGAESYDNKFISELETLLRKRYASLKPTIISTNLVPDSEESNSFKKVYGEGIFSVINRCYKKIVIKDHIWS